MAGAAAPMLPCRMTQSRHPCLQPHGPVMTSELHTERRDATLVLTLSDPASRNSLSEQVFAAGIEALNVAESDPAVRAIVLRGDGGHFCAGIEPPQLDPDAPEPSLQHFHAFVEALRVSPKPVVAAVEGDAIAGGFALALACDLVVAAADARLLLANPRAGQSADAGATAQLMRHVPRARVLQWLWLGEPVPVEQLLALGLVTRVSGHGEAFEQALGLAARLADADPEAVSGAKELVNPLAGNIA